MSAESTSSNPAPNPPATPTPGDRAARVLRFLMDPPRMAEIIVAALLVAVAVGLRLYLLRRFPFAIWSRDAPSYTIPAFQWLHTGLWETDPRRGPVYSLLIAFSTRLWGSPFGLVVVQHILGGIAVLAGIAALRFLHGPRALLPVALCGYAYVVYALPLGLEHLVRNDLLLFFFSTLTLGAWLLAIQRDQPHWLWLCGLAASAGLLTKNVTTPLPFMILAGCVALDWKRPRRAALAVVIFLAAFALPLLGARALKSSRPAEPQAGILLYGRTAQFTYLEGGIEPELKQAIRAEVEDYRRRVFADPTRPPALENNIVLKRTIVPHLRQILTAQGKTPADLNRLCKALAFEAIRTHKADYARQVLRDLTALLFTTTSKSKSPTPGDLESAKGALLEWPGTIDPLLDRERTITQLDARMKKKYYNRYRDWIAGAWLFRYAPGLLTTLLLPCFVIFTRSRLRVWWLGQAALWFFTLVLLSTVGRPLDRYLMPVVPVMFWTLASAVTMVYFRILDRLAKRLNLS